MRAADASFDEGNALHMAGLSNLVVVARANCDRSAQRLGELALGFTAGASASGQETKKKDAWARAAYGRLATMLMIFAMPVLVLPTSTLANISNSLEAGQLHSAVFRLDASSVLAKFFFKSIASSWRSLLSRPPGARCCRHAGACPQLGEPGGLQARA
jgi:hypothetical protein